MSSPDYYEPLREEALELNSLVTAEGLALCMTATFGMSQPSAPDNTWAQISYLAELGMTDRRTPHESRNDPVHCIDELCNIIVNSGKYAWAGLIIMDCYDSYLYELEVLPKDPNQKNRKLISAYNRLDKALCALEDEYHFSSRRLHITTSYEQKYDPDIMERAQIIRDAGIDASVVFSVNL